MPDPEFDAAESIAVEEAAPAGGWLNRNVLGMGLTSFLSDFGHEMATAILPAFLASIGAGPAALGTIEGVADAVSSFVKVGAGYSADRWGHRKAVAVLGYVLTGVSKASFALASSWPPVLAGRVVGWFGRGIRGPVRDAMLAESVPPEARGRAFGFHRAGDTAGAVAGPLVALLLLGVLDLRGIFVLTLIPGLLSALAFALLVSDPPRRGGGERFLASLRAVPRPFRRLLVAVGLFGIADFAPTLLILQAQLALTPSLGRAAATSAGVALYLLRNALYTVASYPLGALSDRFGRRDLLAGGYALAGLTFAGFAWLPARLPVLGGLFALAGVFIAAEDTLEGALAADLLPERGRGLGYGLLGSVNGVGDLVSSVVVGALWAALGATAGFAYATALSLAAAAVLLVAVRPPAAAGE